MYGEAIMRNSKPVQARPPPALHADGRRAGVGTFIQYIRKSSALKSSQFSSSAED